MCQFLISRWVFGRPRAYEIFISLSVCCSKLKSEDLIHRFNLGLKMASVVQKLNPGLNQKINLALDQN
jgi:hypothetical protein